MIWLWTIYYSIEHNSYTFYMFLTVAQLQLSKHKRYMLSTLSNLGGEANSSLKKSTVWENDPSLYSENHCGRLRRQDDSKSYRPSRNCEWIGNLLKIKAKTFAVVANKKLDDQLVIWFFMIELIKTRLKNVSLFLKSIFKINEKMIPSTLGLRQKASIMKKG